MLPESVSLVKYCESMIIFPVNCEYFSLSDFNESRLEAAKKFGATATVLLKAGQTENEIKEKIIAGLGRMPDTVLECCGAEASIRLAIAVSCK